MAKQIIKVVAAKGKRAAVLAVRQEFRGKDIVNIRECLVDGDDEYSATRAGFTLPVENFGAFYSALRKFGRDAGLLPKKGEDDFSMKSLAELDEGDDEIVINSKGATEEAEEKVKGKKGKKAKAEKEEKPKRGRKAKDEDDEEEEKPKRGRKAKTDDDEDDEPAVDFDMKGFKKAIKSAIKHDDDMSYAAEVVKLYKSKRKVLKDVLPKHAVNAFEKSIENKKDDSYLAKAVLAAQKHIVEKDFTL